MCVCLDFTFDQNGDIVSTSSLDKSSSRDHIILEERECVFVREKVCEIENVCVCVREKVCERERMWVCVRRERDRMCVCL